MECRETYWRYTALLLLHSCYTPITPVEYGAVIDNIHIRFTENEIGIFLPFTDNEKICWECGGQRILELKSNYFTLSLLFINVGKVDIVFILVEYIFSQVFI